MLRPELWERLPDNREEFEQLRSRVADNLWEHFPYDSQEELFLVLTVCIVISRKEFSMSLLNIPYHMWDNYGPGAMA